MPFKSEAQHRKFRAMLASGEIDKKTFNKWMRETKKKYGKEHPIKPLPERVEKRDMEKGSMCGKTHGKKKKPAVPIGAVKAVMKKRAKVLTTAGRDRIKEKNFAIPERDAYPIHDMAHARNALARVSAYGSPSEKSRVQSAVYNKYPGLKKRHEERIGKMASLLKIAYGGGEEFSMTESTGPLLKRVGSAPPSPGRMKEFGKMSAQRKYMGQQAGKVKGIMGMSGGTLQPGLGQSIRQARPAFLQQLPREKQLEWAGSTKTGALDIIKFAACNSKRKRKCRKPNASDVRRAADEARKKAAFGSWYPPILKSAATDAKLKEPKVPTFKTPKSAVPKAPTVKTKVPKLKFKSKPPVIKGEISDLRTLKKHLYKSMNK